MNADGRVYPQEAVAQSRDKEFHRWLLEFGLEDELHGSRDLSREDRSHPYIAVDMSRCIDCYRCVRICETDLLVAGAGPGSKYAKARTLGVRVIDDGEFQKLIGARG